MNEKERLEAMNMTESKEQKLVNVMGGLTMAHNAMMDLNPNDYPEIPKRIFSALWVELEKLHAQVVIVIHFTSKEEHVEDALIG